MAVPADTRPGHHLADERARQHPGVRRRRRRGLRALVYSSSVGAYAPGPKDTAVDESWPAHGWPGAAYTREKAYLERVLDAFEPEHPDVRVARLRPGFVFTQQSASQQRRLFIGLRQGTGLATPPLAPSSARGRVREIVTGVGRRP